MLYDYHNLKYGYAPSPNLYIDNFYQTAEDYRKYPYTKLLINDREYKAWRDSLISLDNYDSYYQIKEYIDKELYGNTNPYLYRDKDGRIFMIQNVEAGSINRAITTANVWSDYKVNIGFNSSDDKRDIPHIIYAIDEAAKLIIVKNNTLNNPKFERILYYGSATDFASGKEAKYGAMLPLL